MSERTKQLKKKKVLWGFVSTITWVGVALFLIIFALATGTKDVPQVATPDDTSVKLITEEGRKWLLSIGITGLIGVISAILIKDKIRTFVWMASVVLSVILFGKWGMFVVLFLWLIEEYVFCALFKHYCHLVQINKEIDLRE